MLIKRKRRNRRLEQSHVLDVKLRSDQVKKARLRFLTVGLTFAILLFSLTFAAWRGGDYILNELVYENDTFSISTIEIQTDGSISTEQIRKWAMVKKGDNLIALDLARVKRDLELVPIIEFAAIERVMPDTLKIRIIEREPVAQVFTSGRRSDGEIETLIYHLDANGVVIPPLNSKLRSAQPAISLDQLPLITGVPISEIRPGRPLNDPQMIAALRLVLDFETSPMAGISEVKRIDVGTPDLLYLYTSQDQEIIFSLNPFDTQLNRWRLVHDNYQARGKAVVNLDLSISNNLPIRWVEASLAAPAIPKPSKPLRHRRKNV
jgi:hypothetical protein